MNDEVIEAFGQFDQHIKLADSDRTLGQERMEKVSQALEKNSNFVQCLPFGSFGRSTAVRPFSDVDLLANFEFPRRGERDDPQYLLDILESLVRGTVGDTRRHRNAISILYPEWPSVDIVPAMQSQKEDQGELSFLIPNVEGMGWQVYEPHVADRQIEERVKSLGGEFKGVIRMMKWWSKIKGGVVESYKIETIAFHLFVETLPPYPQAIYEFFGAFLGLIPTPRFPRVRSAGALSLLADARHTAQEALRLGERNQAASRERAIETWRELFGEQFPQPAR
jgi:predicted nucleotidyltransferase